MKSAGDYQSYGKRKMPYTAPSDLVLFISFVFQYHPGHCAGSKCFIKVGTIPCTSLHLLYKWRNQHRGADSSSLKSEQFPEKLANHYTMVPSPELDWKWRVGSFK